MASFTFTLHALQHQIVRVQVKCSKLQPHFLILKNPSVRFQSTLMLGKKTKKRNLRSQPKSKKRLRKLKALRLKLLLKHNQSQLKKLFHLNNVRLITKKTSLESQLSLLYQDNSVSRTMHALLVTFIHLVQHSVLKTQTHHAT